MRIVLQKQVGVVRDHVAIVKPYPVSIQVESAVVPTPVPGVAVRSVHSLVAKVLGKVLVALFLVVLHAEAGRVGGTARTMKHVLGDDLMQSRTGSWELGADNLVDCLGIHRLVLVS